MSDSLILRIADTIPDTVCSVRNVTLQVDSATQMLIVKALKDETPLKDNPWFIIFCVVVGALIPILWDKYRRYADRKEKNTDRLQRIKDQDLRELEEIRAKAEGLIRPIIERLQDRLKHSLDKYLWHSMGKESKHRESEAKYLEAKRLFDDDLKVYSEQLSKFESKAGERPAFNDLVKFLDQFIVDHYQAVYDVDNEYFMRKEGDMVFYNAEQAKIASMVNSYQRALRNISDFMSSFHTAWKSSDKLHGDKITDDQISTVSVEAYLKKNKP